MTSSKLAEICMYVNAIQKYKELVGLIDFIRTKPEPKNIMEIGTDRGGTFWLWCQLASSDGKIISVDIPDERISREQIENENRYLAAYAKDGQSTFFIREDSHLDSTEEKVVETLGNEQLDILFIDGDHYLEGVTMDFERYKKYVKKEGLIVFHDIVKHTVTYSQVDILWNNLKSAYKEWYEFIDEEDDDRGWGPWGGIGVLINQK